MSNEVDNTCRCVGCNRFVSVDKSNARNTKSGKYAVDFLGGINVLCNECCPPHHLKERGKQP